LISLESHRRLTFGESAFETSAQVQLDLFRFLRRPPACLLDVHRHSDSVSGDGSILMFAQNAALDAL
jgi:hypothetical protein